ncbi:hypothetical protein ARMGADRAFT_273017 [Armillaria gallica]|uniref:Protein kinase domain-containing protein n=1 Tax=Armillaria gallica TaxID=47427 RepID=A0A2H3EJ63_ARMGA|nr:hypothetical protein ARMGADRAFT_273017 [Armillaria gallica]
MLKKFDVKEGLRWTAFPNDPKASGHLEDEAFKYMATMAAAIVKVARKMIPEGPVPTTVMECKPHEVAISEGRDDGFKSDGHYRLLQTRRPDYVENATSTTPIKPPASIKLNAHKLACDRPAPEEYERGDESMAQNSNSTKLVGNASQATVSILVLLTSDHSCIESFNFIKDYTHLICYVLSLSFATAEELGYDMSITRVAYPLAANPSEHIIQYDYHIGGDTYRTVKCLSSFRASCVPSRATRVWTVCRINDPKHPQRALKDVWVPSNAKTELEIQQENFRSTEENHPEIGKEYRKKYFMEILECEVVQTSQNCNDDMPVFVRERLEIIGDLALYTPETAKVPRTMPGSIISTPTRASLANPDTDNKLRLYNGRKHVRVVFADVGTPLSDIWQPRVLFNALSDALEGLHHLYMGHYVHRDIFAGNIILCNGVGKISDLEYAKKFLSQGPADDPTIGTPIYMAVEVQDAAYLFLNRSTLRNHASTPVLHNYLHDVKSLFWIGIYALFSTVPAKYPKAQLALRVEQHKLFNALFPCHLEALPTEYKSVVKVLLSIHEVLVDHYDKVENLKDFPQQEQFNQVYGTEPLGGLLAPFEAGAKEAYSGDTQSLFSDDPIIITRPARAPIYRETTNDGDRDDDQTYIFDELEQTESSADDEEPPSKVQRKNGKTKEKADGRSHHESLKQESVEGIHSGEKRKRLL